MFFARLSCIKKHIAEIYIARKIILSFGISVFLNYLLYWVLYFSHLYSKKSILCVFFIELIILVWYEKNNVRSLIKKNVIDISKTKILLLFKNIQVTVGNRYKYGVFLFFLNLGTIISLGLFLIYSFGSIFLSNDDFIHWIEWARSWEIYQSQKILGNIHNWCPLYGLILFCFQMGSSLWRNQ